MRPVSSGVSGAEAAISVARSSVTRRRSHRSAAGAGGAGAGDGTAGGAGEGRALRGSARRAGAGASPDRSPYFSIRARRVLREMPRSDAVREMFQLVCRSTSTTRSGCWSG